MTRRRPYSPSSAANVRHRPSIAAQAVSKPPTLGNALRAGPPVIVRITGGPARALSDHAPRHCPRGQELRPRSDRDRACEILERHLVQRLALDILHADGVEQNIDPPRRLGYSADVLLNGLLVQSIDLCRLCHSSGGTNRL